MYITCLQIHDFWDRG